MTLIFTKGGPSGAECRPHPTGPGPVSGVSAMTINIHQGRPPLRGLPPAPSRPLSAE